MDLYNSTELTTGATQSGIHNRPIGRRELDRMRKIK
ncbi:hypothetical protein MLGJGCBP_06311 [Rhodococcus sp. T7]|nr:hypothetical protein MLGJGCBP_09771 [Rhodococcus sp. T7]KAF0960582.1 hypothetical protein MLGJGCBP_06311 [Rhodococcus sp. T7]